MYWCGVAGKQPESIVKPKTDFAASIRSNPQKSGSRSKAKNDFFAVPSAGNVLKVIGLTFGCIIAIVVISIYAEKRESKRKAEESTARIQQLTEEYRSERAQERGQQEADRIAREIVKGMADNVYYTYLRQYQLPVKRLQITSIQTSGISGGEYGGTMDIRFSWRMPLSASDRQLLGLSRQTGTAPAHAVQEVLTLANGTNHQVRVHFRQDGFGDYTYETELLY